MTIFQKVNVLRILLICAVAIVVEVITLIIGARAGHASRADHSRAIMAEVSAAI